MRDFKEPYYTGPDCACCALKRERLWNELRATARARLEATFGHLWTFTDEELDEIVNCVVGR